MSKTYKAEIGCADCAAKMEEAIGKLDGVQKVRVNFMTQKMSVEFADGTEPAAVMKTVLKNCKKVEDDCEIFLS